MTDSWKIVRELTKRNPDALLMEPREVYDEALIGITDNPDDHWPRKPGVWIAVYDGDRVINLMTESYLSEEDLADEELLEEARLAAQDHMSYNAAGGWLGPGTPTFSWEMP